MVPEPPRAITMGTGMGSQGISARSSRRLWFQIPIFSAMCIFCYVYSTWKSGSRHTLTVGTVPNTPLSFEEAVLGRRLADNATDCSGVCKSTQVKQMEDGLNEAFIMIKGSVMLKYRDPYDCDELMLPTGDDSDDQACILEIGQGRRRQARENARTQAIAAGAEVCIIDDVFYRNPADNVCEKRKEKGQVCVSPGAEEAVSGGALAVVREEKMIWIIWYVFGIFYMMAGLAIVCDEFFVPALECFVDEFGISMDVAGATFMAAGGSMPELFTSFIATFQESEVGFVAIVGSAVFNVLFVIAVCAIASTEVLSLTWWPLARDCSFYVIALLTVAFVFSVSSKNKIEHWEAIILLLEYVSYCCFMKFNGKVYTFIEKRLHKKKVVPVDTENQPRITKANSEGNAHFLTPSKFRVGIVQLLTKNSYLYETAGIAAVTQIRGELEETFKRLDKDNDGKINIKEVQELLQSLGVKSDSSAIKTSLRRINRSGDEEITFDAFKRWYLASEARIEAEMQRVFDKFDADKNGFIQADELANVLKAMGHKPTDQDIADLMKELVTTSDTPDGEKRGASLEQFEVWYNQSLFYQKKEAANACENEEEENEGLTLDYPENPCWSALFWYIFTYPLCAILHCSLPDVRVPKYQRNARMAILEFGLSLIWIGIFSNWLYECLVVVSNTCKIPVAVSAVTLLAGGTSVPDLLSSYVVAKNGEGDMAVSSSIGSNIFDVTVGLPLPWLVYIIVKGKPFELGPQGSKGLGFSILLLVLMLGAVIGTIIIMRWRLTKPLGYVMFVFYILYVVQYLLQKLPPSCNANEIGVFQIAF